jgi:molybdopterin-guanine dinucleotide biosynthesis protein A
VAPAGLTGILLVGGGSNRFGSPKALAPFGGETLAERAWRTLGTVCDERIAVGKKSDGLSLPFEILDDESEIRAPLAGVVAGLRRAAHDRCVVLPVDTPLVREEHLRALAAAGGDAAVPQTGPLPGVYARSVLPELERRLRGGKLALRDALIALDTQVVELDRFLLANVNTPADLALAEARARALRAAEMVARRQGIDGVAPAILQDWNDTIVHLRPAPIVARVRTSWLRDNTDEPYERELAVVSYAAARNAPVVAPTRNPSPGPHHADGLVVSLWDYVEQLAGDVPPLEAGQALRALHDAIADYPVALPSLWNRLDRAQATTDDPSASPALAEEDREFLAQRLRKLRSSFQQLPLPERNLHGAPHTGNLLRTSTGPRWIDFDTVCRGPLEWDLAHLPEDAAAAFPETRRDALAIARQLVGAEVAVWCWRTYGRAPEVDEAAQFHLGRLRRAE